jgi:hypothetical protein
MIMAIKANKEEEKTLERAQKDAEMVSEFAKDARNRKAKTVSKKLESEIADREENQVNTNSVSLSAQQQEHEIEKTLSAQQQEHEIEKILDKTKDNIRFTTKTAAKESPQYTRMIGDMQEETVKTMREVADDYVESQKEIINLYQSGWTPLLENANSRFWNYWRISPKVFAETYGTVVNGLADNVVSATRLTNNTISTNIGLASTVLQQTKDNSKEFSRLGVNAARVFSETSKGIANSNLFRL